jgi:hypothetical protein
VQAKGGHFNWAANDRKALLRATLSAIETSSIAAYLQSVKPPRLGSKAKIESRLALQLHQ